MNSRAKLHIIRAKRTRRTRAKLFGTGTAPRLAVFRSNQYVYAQLIDDEKGTTLAFATSKGAKGAKTKSEQATVVGTTIAEKAKALGVKQAVFDRRGYRYHGRVKSLAEAARAGGLKI